MEKAVVDGKAVEEEKVVVEEKAGSTAPGLQASFTPKSGILIVGGTGYIGKHVARASARLGKATYILARPDSLKDARKEDLFKSFRSEGIKILVGDLRDHKSLVAALKEVDVVISTVGGYELNDQLRLIDAIKEVAHIKRFYPSEFGVDVERATILTSLHEMFLTKIKVRRAIEDAKIPYTYIVSGGFAGYWLLNLAQEGKHEPPNKGDEVTLTIYGSGNQKVVFMDEADIGTYTVKSVDDPRAENKLLYFQPKNNIFTQREAIALWEKKMVTTFDKKEISEADFIQLIEDSPYPVNMFRSITYSIFIKGESYLSIPPNGVEVTQLYPDVKYVTVNDLLNRCIVGQFARSGKQNVSKL